MLYLHYMKKNLYKNCQNNLDLRIQYILKADLQKLGQIKIFINFVKEIFTNIDILINYAGIKLNNDNIINTNLLKMSDAILNNEKKIREM